MRYADYMPRQEAIFCTWLAMFFIYVSENLLRFGIAGDVFMPLTALRVEFEEKYVIATAPSTRTKAAVLAKNEALDALKTALRAFVREYLTYNHLVTDSDRENMGLPVRKATRANQLPGVYD